MKPDSHAWSPGSKATRLERQVAESEAGTRLDQYLAASFPEISRRKARTLIDIGGVFVDGRRAKQAGRPVATGQKVHVHLGGAIERAARGVGQVARAADASRLPPIEILFEDEHLIVVDKPAGLLTAPTPESDRNNLADQLARREPGPPAPIHVVHRIDLQTSGVLVLGKTSTANRLLSAMFVVHAMERRYFAVVSGVFPEDVKEINKPVGGRSALTHIVSRTPLGTIATLLELQLETGRTHQIRLHCVGLGHGVLGDPEVRGLPGLRPPRMALHAAVLGFEHPVTGEKLRFERPWPPPDLAEWFAAMTERHGAGV